MTRGRYQATRATRRVFGRNIYNTTLESAVDPERQLELSRERRENLVPAEVLYSNNRIRVPSRVTVNERLSRSLSLQFERYRQAPQPARYDAPKNTTSIEETAATSWGDEFLDDETTPGRVTILNELEEQSDWDDDERSGGKILIIQEKLAQNQQDFLDEYLPQWDDQLATRKQRSELEWENPFAAKRGEDHTMLHLSKNKEKDDDLYRLRRIQHKYQPPPDAIMGPAVYPPARQNPQLAYKPDYQFGYPQGKCNTFYEGYGKYHNSQWTLPPAWTKSGVMLVLPADPGLWSDVISRWESITINRLNSQTWSDNKARLAFVENLLGESEKLMWKQWRTAYPGAYYALETIADDPQNITSQVRQLIIMEDPYRGSTNEQDMAYRDLDRITCEETKNLWSFLEDFRQKYKDDRGRFKKCKCFICGKEGHFAKDYRSKQGNISRSAVYQELDLDDNWDIVLADFNDSSVYSISEVECDQNISIMIQDTPFEEAAFMTIEEINESDDEQNIEGDYDSHHAFMFHPGTPTKIADMVQSAGSWKPDKELPTQSKSCEHDWKENTVTNYTICYYCRILTTDMSRLNCPKCQLTTCALCAKNYLGKTVNVKRKQQQKSEEEKDFSNNEVRLLKELLKEKTEQVQQMIRDQAKEYYEGKIAMQENEEL
uniref:CCHC-type domain-containing protein n=1 Tax=Tanacetum cinerariifolium TaxID=118510 RepID=A0A6L2KWQ2_TANCI|nr:hypothetical protein AMTR_s00071p00160240 [Tanacetum cinerariifolium]